MKATERIRIIIADDHAVVREGTRTLLEREADMELVGEAGDGDKALELIATLKPDVAILDINMPGISGIEVTRRAKPLSPQTAVLILTVYDNDEYIFSLLEAGAAGYLLKDAPTAELIKAVRSIYAGEPVLHPSIANKVIRRALKGRDKAGGDYADSELSQREKEVLQLAAKGMSNQAIADKLHLSIRTVQRHLNSIFNKLSVGSRTEAIFQSVKRGWLSFEDIV
ncbi:MAG: response regulator transcription factor [Dehalococcoidia bacterium]|jgi:DNA-binding NarL/FixJ family response regulator